MAKGNNATRKEVKKTSSKTTKTAPKKSAKKVSSPKSKTTKTSKK
jgi:hypothetical protein